MLSNAAKVTFVLVFCFLSSVCLASSDDKTIDRLIDLSGLTKQVEMLPEMLKTGLQEGAQQGGGLPADKMMALMQSVDGNVSPLAILTPIHESLKASLSGDEVEQLLAWYESDLGKKITAIEEQASTTEAYMDMMEKAPQLMADTKRVESAMKMDELLGATEMGVNAQMSISLAVVSAMMKIAAPDQEVQLDGFKAQMAAMEPQMKAGVQQMTILSFVYTYQSVDDARMAKYMAFLDNTTTRKFNDLAVAGMTKGLETAIAKWVGDLSSLLKAECQPECSGI